MKLLHTQNPKTMSQEIKIHEKTQKISKYTKHIKLSPKWSGNFYCHFYIKLSNTL